MPRFIVSVLAGILVILGGWYGWTHGGEVDDAIAGTTDRVPGVEATTGSGDSAAGGGVALPGSAQATRASGDASTPTGPSGPSDTATTSAPARSGARTSASPSTPPSPGSTMSTKGSDPGQSCDTPAPTDAGGMNRLIDQLDGEPRLKGGDHGGSIALADGRRMFVFGDTVRDTSVVSSFMVRNSVLVANGGCITPMTGADDGPVIPNASFNTGYWPMSLRADTVSGGTRVQVMTNTVIQRDKWQTAGTGLATFDVPTNRMPRLTSHVAIGSDATDASHPTWGAAMWDSGGKVYVFGTASNAAKTTAGWSLHVARTTPANLSRPGAWEYWDGGRWVTGDRGAARGKESALIPADMGVSHVLSVFERKGSWYAVSKEGDFHGRSLTVWKADSVTGPWVKHRVQPLRNSGDHLRYTPLAHPDFPTAPGRVLVSWSESPPTLAEYDEKYRPRFDEISLP